MNFPKFPSYYFEFTLESNQTHLIILEMDRVNVFLV